MVYIWKENGAWVEGVITYITDDFQLIKNGITWWDEVMLMVINKQVEAFNW